MSMSTTKTMKFLFLMMFSTLLCSCSDNDDSPFAGSDDYIVSFSLTNDGQTVKAIIRDETIVVDAPVDFQLLNATATVKVSENSSIKPNPKSITDWSSEYVFVVTSRNGQKKSYRYTVENNGLNAKSTVLLTTQEEVDAFGAKGITSIDGNLIIGTSSGFNTISSLEPLNKLKSVSHGVIIKGTFSGKTLGGLSSLEKIGGLLRIETSGLKEATFPALTSAMHIEVASKSLISISCPKLLEMTGNLTFAVTSLKNVIMPKLQKVAGEVYFSVPQQRDPSALENISFPALEQIGGQFAFGESNLLKSISLPVLKSVGSLTFGINSSTPSLTEIFIPKLEICNGEMRFHQLANMNVIEFPMLTYIGRDLISKYCHTEKINLPKLETVGGDIILSDIGNLNGEGLKGFGSLKSLKGKLEISASLRTSMTELPMPTQLKKIGTLSLFDVSTLKTLDITGINIDLLELHRATLIDLTIKGDENFKGNIAFDGDGSTNATSPYEYSFPTFLGIKQVKNLEFYSLAYLTDIKVKGLTKVNGDIIIHDNNNMEAFEMQDVTEIGGDVLTEMCGYITNQKLEFASVTKIGGYVRVGGLYTYYGFSSEEASFPNLKTAGGISLALGSNVKKVSMPKLTTVSDSLKIICPLTVSEGNMSLTELYAFAKLTKVKAVHIENMKGLKSYEGLKNCLNGLVDDSQWQMINNYYNPTLADMKAGKWNKE